MSWAAIGFQVLMLYNTPYLLTSPHGTCAGGHACSPSVDSAGHGLGSGRFTHTTLSSDASGASFSAMSGVQIATPVAAHA